MDEKLALHKRKTLLDWLRGGAVARGGLDAIPPASRERVRGLNAALRRRLARSRQERRNVQ